MTKQQKFIGFGILFLSLSMAFIALYPKEYRDYPVVITYCSGLQDTLIISDYRVPSTSNIKTYKEAVPIYYGQNKKYLNVCEIKPL